MVLQQFRFILCIAFLFTWKANCAQLNTTRVTPISELKASAYNFTGINNTATCRGPKGEVYTAKAEDKVLRFQSSSAAGSSTGKIIAPVKNAWRYTVNGIELKNLPSLACDLTGGQFKGRIYVCWSDDKYLAADRDVFLSYSDDAGNTWTEPVLVTYRPNHKSQFSPRIAVDKNGSVNILYYDKQNSADDSLTDIYLAQSRNGGLKFDYYRVNSQPFKFTPDRFLSLEAGDALRLAWSESDLMMHTVTVNDPVLSDYNRQTALREIDMARTFVYSDPIKIDFKLKNKSLVSASVTKPLDPGFEKQIWKNRLCEKGNTTLLIDPREAGLEKGNYIVTLYYDCRNSFAWIIEE